jgi:hypothetical protein
MRGAKTCEIRRNDRDFKVGDGLLLRRTKYTGNQMYMRPGYYPLEYTGEECRRVVSHVLTGYGLEDNCALSFATPTSPKDAGEASGPLAGEAVEAVLAAVREWGSERSISDWCEADLMKAIVRLDGDWPGCDECDHQCDEPCMPATVDQMLASIDRQIAQLVHEGKLGAYIGYEPPADFQPYPPRRKTIPIARATQPPTPQDAAPAVAGMEFPPRALKLLQIAAKPESYWQDEAGESLTIDAAKALEWIAAATPAVVQPTQVKADDEKRPINCGTGYCSCIECPYAPAKAAGRVG